MKKDFLTAMAIGDAMGMKLEFIEHDRTISMNDLHYGSHPIFLEYKKCHYTDDTQMSIANSEILLKLPQIPTDDDFIKSWLNAFRRDPHLGHSKHMHIIMSETSQSMDLNDFRGRLTPEKGVTSGGAMRAGVFGLLADIAQVKFLTIQQAKITHNTPSAINSALAVALSVHYLHHGGDRQSVLPFVRHHLSEAWNSTANGYTALPENGLNIATQMLNVVSQPATLTQTLLSAMNCADKTDTDTLCALSLQVASRDKATQNDLPQHLYDTLEHGPYGLGYLKKLDRDLMKKFPPRSLYESQYLPQFLGPRIQPDM